MDIGILILFKSGCRASFIKLNRELEWSGRSNPNLVDQLREMGVVLPQVTGQVFMRHEEKMKGKGFQK
jgi:hypothetical protein